MTESISESASGSAPHSLPGHDVPDFVPINGKLTLGENVAFGFQHVIAMFGSTVLGPLLMGFDPNVSILFSGLGTLIFFAVVKGGKIPSYLGSSFSFIAAVNTATAYSGTGGNAHISIALGGIIAAGIVYASVGLIVMWLGHRWLERLLPPVLTGLIVGIIGLNLASVAVGDITHSQFATFFGILTIFIVSICNVYLPKLLARLPILIGGGISYILYAILCNLLHMDSPIDFSPVAQAAWLGLPGFRTPTFDLTAISLIAPVALVLIAENLGHVRAVASMTHTNLDQYLGRAFLADGLATVLAGSGGGTGVTTYAENIGVMNMTRVFSSRMFLFAAMFAIVFSFSPKFGAAVHTIPLPLLGGLAFMLFGLITAAAMRIWHNADVDFTKPFNSIPVGVGLIMGAGNLTVTMGSFALGGIAMATLTSILLYHLLARHRH